MATPRYSSAQNVADHLGVDLTGLQMIEAERLLLAAESWIDSRMGRTWGVTASTTEQQTATGQAVYLRKAPVSAVSALAIRSTYVGASWDTLPASSYELADAAQGLVLLPWGYAGWWVRVTYVPAQTIDARVSLAATKLAAHWLQPTITGEDASSGGSSSAIKNYTLGSELTVAYDTTASTASTTGTSTTLKGVPDDVLALLAGLREPVLV